MKRIENQRDKTRQIQREGNASLSTSSPNRQSCLINQDALRQHTMVKDSDSNSSLKDESIDKRNNREWLCLF